MLRKAFTALALTVVAAAASGCGGEDGSRVLRSGTSAVLVAADPGPDAAIGGVGYGGYVAMVGGCLGMGDATVVWPYGTEVASDDPLTIDVPGLGTLRVGDPASGGAVEYGDQLPEGLEAPSDCPTEHVIAFYPDR
jgi:hypothetical protein